MRRGALEDEVACFTTGGSDDQPLPSRANAALDVTEVLLEDLDRQTKLAAEIVKLPLDVLGPICRRVCIMAQINWWSKEPALGTLTVIGAHKFLLRIGGPWLATGACLALVTDYIFFVQWQVHCHKGCPAVSDVRSKFFCSGC